MPKGREHDVISVGQNLSRTSNLIGSCWPEALLFQSWGSLLVLFGLGLSIVFLNQSCEPCLELPAQPLYSHQYLMIAFFPRNMH